MQPAVPLRIVPILPNRSVERVESLEVSVILHIFGSTSNSATMKHTKRSTRETCSLYASLKYRWARIKRRYYICMKEPVALTRLLYRMTFGHDPDLERPQTYNEKVLWLKLFTDTSLWTLLADKYRVREYVRQRIGRGGGKPAQRTVRRLGLRCGNRPRLVAEQQRRTPVIRRAQDQQRLRRRADRP